MARRYYSEFYDFNDNEIDYCEFLAMSSFDAASYSADLIGEINADYCLLFDSKTDIQIGLIAYDRTMISNGIKSYV